MRIKALLGIIRKFPWKWILLFSFLLLIFLTNTYHEEYPDEYDSIVGGLYITQGKLPYKDWFQHHQPFAYVWASMLLPLAGRSFVGFRLLLAISFFTLNVGAFFLLRKRLKGVNLSFYLFYLFTLAFAATYFWGQMLLADTLAAYLIIPAYTLVLLKSFSRDRFETRDLLIVSLFTFFAWLASLSFTYLLAVLNLYAIYLFFKSQRELRKNFWRTLIKVLAVFGLPYFIFFLYLLLTGSLQDYYFANIVYNQRYYIYGYPRPLGTPVNPIRYAVVVISNFVNNFFPLLSTFKDFNFGDPFMITLAVSNGAFFVYSLLRKKYAFILPSVMILIFSCVRVNPFAIKQTDYQASVYILISFVNGLFTLFALREVLDKGKLLFSEKIIASFLLLLLGAYWFFNGLFIPLKYFQKYYEKYMGNASLIYDRPEVAPLVDQITGDNEYTWIGPFEFKELFYLRSKVPSKYHWFLEHGALSEKIRNEIIADFTERKPKLIVFNRGFAPFGGDPKEHNWFFIEFLDEHYFRLFTLNQELEDFQYKWKVHNTQNFDIDGDFNFSKERKDEILDELLDLGLIEKVAKS